MKKSMDLATASNLAETLREIGPDFERLIWEETKVPLTEDEKQQIADQIAERLGWNQPRQLRRLIKGGSVDSLVNMSQEMEALFMAVRK
jgi:electron transfer flavoprotein alpha/beta subunit